MSKKCDANNNSALKKNDAETEVLNTYRAKLHAKKRAPKMKVECNPAGQAQLSHSGDTDMERAINQMAMNLAFGTISSDFASCRLMELLGAGCNSKPADLNYEKNMNGLLAAMHGIAPRDEMEGMLAAQMVATHSAAMRLLCQTKGSESLSQQDSNGNLAIKLLRTYAIQMEALQRYRGKGQQKVTVEHVHVHAGGQAIVGNVTRPEGGGVTTKTEEQPHAKHIDYAPMPEMPSPHKERQSVPVARDA